MFDQIDKKMFSKALTELGHNPTDYKGKKLSLDGMSKLYQIECDTILDAIDKKHISAHYDYQKDTIWIDALDAAHFYYCMKSQPTL